MNNKKMPDLDIKKVLRIRDTLMKFEILGLLTEEGMKHLVNLTDIVEKGFVIEQGEEENE